MPRNVAEIQWGRGDDQGLETAREGAAVAERWLALDDPQRFNALSALADNLRVRIRNVEALAVTQRAADLAHEQFGAHRPNAILARAEDDLAYVLTFIDRPAEAVALARRALTDVNALKGDQSMDAQWALTVLARALSESGQLTEAMEAERRAIGNLTRLSTGPSVELAIRHERLGQTLLDARRPDQALEQMNIADRLTAAAGPVPSRWARDMQLDRAEALIYLARIDEGAGLVEATSRQLNDDPNHQWARMARLRAQALHLAGQGSTAVDPASAALRRAQDERLGPGSGAALRVALAQALLDAGQAKSARPLLVEALALYDTAQVSLSPRVADALVGLGRADLALGDAASAVGSLKRAHEFWQRFDSENLWAAEAASCYGRALMAAGSSDAARELIERARPRLARSPFAFHRRLIGPEPAVRG